MRVDFNQISKAVPFKTLLDHLNIPYHEVRDKITTDDIIVTPSKNLFFPTKGGKGGNILHFYADHANLSIYDAAVFLQKTFLTKEKEKKELPEYELFYHPILEENGIPETLALDYQVGYVKKGVMNGLISFKVVNNGEYVGCFGKKTNEEGFFCPAGFKSGDYLWNLDRADPPYVFLADNPFSALRAIARGFPNIVGMFNKGLTDRQADLLHKYSQIVIFHPAGENIATRLAQQAFVKLVKADIADLTDEQIDSTF